MHWEMNDVRNLETLERSDSCIISTIQDITSCISPFLGVLKKRESEPPEEAVSLGAMVIDEGKRCGESGLSRVAAVLVRQREGRFTSAPPVVVVVGGCAQKT